MTTDAFALSSSMDYILKFKNSFSKSLSSIVKFIKLLNI